MNKVSYEFTVEEINLLLEALGSLPLGRSLSLFFKIRDIANSQAANEAAPPQAKE